jgi:hypothetical protein
MALLTASAMPRAGTAAVHDLARLGCCAGNNRASWLLIWQQS